MPIALSMREISNVLEYYIQSEEDDNTATRRLIAQRSNVSVGKVHELITAFENGATVEELVKDGIPSTPNGTYIMDDYAQDVLLSIVQQPQALYLSEVAEEFFVRTEKQVHISTISRTLAKLGFTHKKIHCRAREANAKAQMIYRHKTSTCLVAEQLVFVDEVGTTRTVHRTGQYDFIDERTKVKQLQVKSQAISAVGVLSGSDGLIDWIMVPGEMGFLDFIHALKTVVLPHLNRYPGPNSVVVLDNSRLHRWSHNDEVKRLITSTGAVIQHLPPHSPQFNPIESVSTMVQSFLSLHEDWVQRADITPFVALDTAFRSISFEDAMGFIRETRVYKWDEDLLNRVERERREREIEEEEKEEEERRKKRRKLLAIILMLL